MAPSIWHARFKVEWAKKHLDSLGALVTVLENTGGNRITTYDDTERGLYVIKIQHLPEVEGFRIILTIGDFICSLRASLDHLAWQLALLSTPQPSNELTFPIFEKSTVDTQVRMAKITFGIPEGAIAIMKAMQPYHAGNDYKSTHLWRLNKIWNIDKHRHITGFQEIPNTWEINFSGFDATKDAPLETQQINNQTIMCLPIRLKEKVRFNPDVKVEFEINESSEGIVIGYKDLVDMYEFVDKTVFPAFASFFPEPEVPGETQEGLNSERTVGASS
jgi:hypothetical protein